MIILSKLAEENQDLSLVLFNVTCSAAVCHVIDLARSSYNIDTADTSEYLKLCFGDFFADYSGM